jgi:hypothetical protein
MDLDAILDDAASSHFKDAPPPAPAPVKKLEPAEIKPWLAATANVPPEFRDKWTPMVRKDLAAKVVTKFMPSNAYRRWETGAEGKAMGENKLLQEMVRSAASRCQFDDVKLNKLVSMANPITDSEQGTQLIESYKKQLLKTHKNAILNDVNYNPQRFPKLAAALQKVSN